LLTLPEMTPVPAAAAKSESSTTKSHPVEIAARKRRKVSGIVWNRNRCEVARIKAEEAAVVWLKSGRIGRVFGKFSPNVAGVKITRDGAPKQQNTAE
jgi:hypothetical protein